MKILHLSTSDIEGGAARASYRLHQALLSKKSDSQMLVRAKFSSDREVIAEKSLLTKLGPPTTSWPLRFYPQRDRAMFSVQWFPDILSKKVKSINPDIINLHWVCNGFLQIETLAKFNKPIVWTLHDMWAFTGGCHYAGDCDNYQHTCGSCPHLKSNQKQDLSFWTKLRKEKAWYKLNLTIVSPSQWLGECARNSSLFKNKPVTVIPHGLDLKKYQPIDKSIARTILHLPLDKKLVLFSAVTGTSDLRKGFPLLEAALQSLSQSVWQDKIELVVVGSANINHFSNLGFKVHCLGQFYDDLSLAVAYSAVDVTVIPSTQEAFGQIASESLACGSPVVAFNTTGILDIVKHQQDGYLAVPFEIQDLARGITWILEDSQRYLQLCTRARQKAERAFPWSTQADRYLSLYDEILSKNK
ncbi:glycosyltransferase family 4 protein [Myxosarcina sp. GI1]|uniref:glycosyltransferase family 4 protein n=1 Tax=Myxosarcina sp. GI1 TaxID=1541065 RepID=UPI00056BEB17|nr:glycosyltransferase family 4 protein [Myxosarcina sp. GI1]